MKSANVIKWLWYNKMQSPLIKDQRKYEIVITKQPFTLKNVFVQI